jgi:hypothetical protein
MSGPYGSPLPPAILIAWHDLRGAWVATAVQSSEPIAIIGPSSQNGYTAADALAGLLDRRFCMLSDQDCPATMVTIAEAPALADDRAATEKGAC